MITSINSIKSSEAKNYTGFRASDKTIDRQLLKKAIEDEMSIEVKTEDKSNTLSAKVEEKDFKLNYDVLKDKLKEIMADESLDIQFAKDEDSNKMIMRLVDLETKETIKQFPPEITLKIARMVAASSEQGILSNAKA